MSRSPFLLHSPLLASERAPQQNRCWLTFPNLQEAGQHLPLTFQSFALLPLSPERPPSPQNTERPFEEVMSVSEQLTGFFAFAERFGVSSSLAAAIVLSLLAMSLKLLLKALSNRPRELNDAQLRVLTSGVDYQKKDALLREMIGEPTGKRYLVVGFGELTRKILSFLVARGETDVRWFTLEDEPSVEGVSEVFFGDLTDETSVSGFFRVHATSNKPKVVFHLWEYFNGHLNNGKDFRACYEVNVCGTKQLLDEAKRSGISLFLFRSAAAVCVTNSDQQNSMLAETDPVSTTLSNYLLTKVDSFTDVP